MWVDFPAGLLVPDEINDGDTVRYKWGSDDLVEVVEKVADKKKFDPNADHKPILATKEQE